MANPQKENGYVATATELFEALLKFRIPGELRQVFDAIIRKTYGFNKKEDYIAGSQICEMTDLKKQNVSRSLSKLITNKLVIKTDYSSGKGNKLKINKDYEAWIPFVIKNDDRKKSNQKRLLKSSKQITKVIRSDDSKSSELMDTIDNRHSIDKLKTRDSPAQNARMFFKGVEDLKNNHIETVEGQQTKLFLQKLQERYPEAPKRVLWDEIVKFWSYWTELNATGRKTRWEKENVFQVERRLGTWFSKIKDFQSKQNPKGNYSPSKIH